MGYRISCDVYEATEGLENEPWRKRSDGRGWRRRRLCSFSNPSIASPMSQLILLIIQPFRRFIYVAAHYPTIPSLHLRHSSFSNPSVASHTSHALHLRRMHFTYVIWRAAHVLLMLIKPHFTVGVVSGPWRSIFCDCSNALIGNMLILKLSLISVEKPVFV